MDSAIIELSHCMLPGSENFRLETRTYDVTEELPEVVHKPDVWYVLSEITMSSHVGTHVEFPFHHWEMGADAATYPLSRLIGRASVLDFSYKSPGEGISREEVECNAHRIMSGDIVFLRTDCDRLYRTDHWDDQPYLEPLAMQWLIDRQPKVIGTDAAGFEVPGTDFQPNHLEMFKHNIAMVESATNLAAIESGTWIVYILPLPIEGIDACPVRIVAVRQEEP